jgi:hypothetical protein
MSNKYLILNKGETPFSQVVNDCETGFCFPVGKGENLSTVIKKLCSYITKLKTEETDPYFRASVASDITANDITNWDLAYSWGDHAGLYALVSHTHPLSDLEQSNATTGQVPVWNGTEWEPQTVGGGGPESDPVFTAWLATNPNLSSFTNDVGYITGYTEGDPVFTSWLLTSPNISIFTNDVGYITSYTETDPIFLASDAASITSGDISNWNTAFGWGDHALAGYLTTAITSLGGLTASTQTFAVGSAGTDFAISSSTSTHTFNIPTASATNRGLLSTTDWSTFNGKVGGSGTTNYLPKWSGTSALTNSQIFDDGTNVGINTASPAYKLDVNGSVRLSNSLSDTIYLLGNSGIIQHNAVGLSELRLFGNYPLLFSSVGTNRVNIGTVGGNTPLGTTELMMYMGDISNTSGIKNGFGINSRFLHSSGTGAVNIFDINPIFNQSGGSPVVRGWYYNPSFITPLQGTNIAWENTSGDVIFGNLAGVGTRMVVVSSTGQISTQAIPGGGSGSVTSVSAGTGMSFSTITTTGSIDIDTNKVPYYSGGFSTGFAKWNGATWVFDSSTYLTTISGLNISSLTNDSGYITSSALSPYLTAATAASTYFPLLGGSITGTAGAGFFGAIAQSSNPSAPTSGFRLFANSTHALSWIGQNGYIRTFDGTANTADRIYTLPNISGTFPLGTGTTNELTYWSGTNTISTLTTATYPSLTELSYVKGVTSSIQPQIDAAKENHLIKAYNAMGSPIKAQSLGLGMHNISSAVTIGATNNSRLTLIAIYLETPQTITGVKWYQGTLGSYTANNENKVGLYTVSGGTLTLVASCTNDGNLWKTAASNTFGAKAFSSTYAASPGLYYIGLLYSNSAVTTAPTIGISSNVVNSNVQSGDFSNGLGLQLVKTTVVALPSSITASTYTQVQQQYWAAIY